MIKFDGGAIEMTCHCHCEDCDACLDKRSIDAIVSILDDIMFRAKDPASYQQIARHKIGIGQIQTRVQLIAGLIDSHEETKLKYIVSRGVY